MPENSDNIVDMKGSDSDMAEKPVGLRLDKVARERLEELSKIYQKPNNKIVSDLICADYDRIQGNPELKKMIDKLNQLQDAITEFNRGETK